MRARSEREQIIERILASQSGIFGTEVCQLDGRLGSYTGYYGAVMSHLVGSEFIASDHRHPTDWERRRERLRKQRHRYCEVCQAKVLRSTAVAVGRHWLCDGCAADPAHWDPDAAYPFVRLIRRRYLERISTEELRTWASAKPPGRRKA